MKIALLILGLLATNLLAQSFDFSEPPKYEKNKSYTIDTKSREIKPWEQNQPEKDKHNIVPDTDTDQRDYSFSIKSK